MKNSDEIAAEAASKTYRKAMKKLAEATGVRAPSTSFPSKDFQRTADLIAKRDRNIQTQLKMWADAMIKAGLHPRFSRLG